MYLHMSIYGIMYETVIMHLYMADFGYKSRNVQSRAFDEVGRIKQETAEVTMAVAMVPTKDAFNKEMEANAIPWRNLNVDEIYRIE